MSSEFLWDFLLPYFRAEVGTGIKFRGSHRIFEKDFNGTRVIYNIYIEESYEILRKYAMKYFSNISFCHIKKVITKQQFTVT
jgi:hypothetical protein